MKLIAVSQRVVISEYNERRDALDQRWHDFLAESGLTAVLIPNHPETARDLLDSVPVEGILLTGGNSLAVCGGDSPERDRTEELMIETARMRDLPLIGVCRGMQALLNFFGAGLEPVCGHVRTRHQLTFLDQQLTVNSYHDWAVKTVPEQFTALAETADGVIEAAVHKSLTMLGIMWHPERSEPFDDPEIRLFEQFFYNRILKI